MQFYVRYFTFYQNSPTRFAGPFPTREVAQRVAASLPGAVFPGQHPQDLKTAWRVMVLPAHKIRAGEFRQFYRDWLLAHHWDEDAGDFNATYPLAFYPGDVESRRLRAIMEKATP